MPRKAEFRDCDISRVSSFFFVFFFFFFFVFFFVLFLFCFVFLFLFFLFCFCLFVFLLFVVFFFFCFFFFHLLCIHLLKPLAASEDKGSFRSSKLVKLVLSTQKLFLPTFPWRFLCSSSCIVCRLSQLYRRVLSLFVLPLFCLMVPRNCSIPWVSSIEPAHENGTYHIGDQQRLRRACA